MPATSLTPSVNIYIDELLCASFSKYYGLLPVGAPAELNGIVFNCGTKLLSMSVLVFLTAPLVGLSYEGRW